MEQQIKLRNTIKYCFRALALTLCIFSSFLYADSLALEAPEATRDGSFVLRLSSSGNFKQLELFRNKNGGNYVKVAEIPNFSSISQIIFEEGTYGYKVRSKSFKSNQSEFSKPIFVDVRRNFRLLPNIEKETSLSANF